MCQTPSQTGLFPKHDMLILSKCLYGGLEESEEGAADLVPGEAGYRGSEGFGIPGAAEGGGQGAGELGGILRRDDQAVGSVDQLGNAADTGGDDRPARGEGFQDDIRAPL